VPVTAEQVAAVITAMNAGVVPSDTPRMRECLVTVCIPVYNAIRTLPFCLESLLEGEQSEPIALMIAENGSEDGTQVLVRAMGGDDPLTRRWWEKRYRSLTVVRVPHDEAYPVAGKQREFANIRECFKSMVSKVATRYILWMDADVEAPRGAVATMRVALEQDDRIGCVGIDYSDRLTHIQNGLMMMRTELAREIVPMLTMTPPFTCMCSQMCAILKEKGLRVVPLSPLSARHLKLEV